VPSSWLRLHVELLGPDRQLDVPIPRLEAEVVIDGDLATPWGPCRAADRFSQYSPTTASRRRTPRRCWSGIPPRGSIRIRAFEQHGRPTATLANRDQIFATTTCRSCSARFHDAKQILMFAVNPLGVQGDGS